MVTLSSIAPFLPVLECSFEGDLPLLLLKIKVLDDSPSVQHSVAPLSLHHPQHLLFGCRMRDCVEDTLAVIGV